MLLADLTHSYEAHAAHPARAKRTILQDSLPDGDVLNMMLRLGQHRTTA